MINLRNQIGGRNHEQTLWQTNSWVLFTKEMAEAIVEKYRLHKERNIVPSTGLAKEKAPLFDYTSFATALSVLAKEEGLS